MGEVISTCQSDDEIEKKPEGAKTGLRMKTMDCDWMREVNEKAHHTDEYETKCMVLRRGQTFNFKATLQRKFNDDFDSVVLELRTGPNPQLLTNTKIRCPLVKDFKKGIWGMKKISEEEKEIEKELVRNAESEPAVAVEKVKVFVYEFSVSIPANSIIGKFRTFIEFHSKLESGETKKMVDAEPDMYIIFNPWCEDDQVYMKDEDERNEYVLADKGIIYRGSTSRISPKYWNFAQFEDHVIECVLKVLDKDKRLKQKPNKWIERRGNPVWVSRAISYLINEHVLIGNWSGDYDGGASPLSWVGSEKIFQQCFESDKPVQYGQCWVFSGVMTTALRSLGIPVRSTTNFASAHDTEATMTIDKYVNKNGKEIELSGDSVWNFHVWNEAWMARPDLPKGYGGWQAVDSTPQEVSLGLFQTGPAPLAAIKKGEVYIGFETGFVFGEVNADRVTWLVEEDPEDGNYIVKKKAAHYKRSVGRNMSTKQVGKDIRRDITDEYKYREGTKEERDAFNKAFSFGAAFDHHKGFLELKKEGEGVTIDIGKIDEVYNGEKLSTKVHLKNDKSEKITCNVTAVLYSTNYTGEKAKFIKRLKYTDVKMEPKGEVTQVFEVEFDEYYKKLTDQQSCRLTVVVEVVENGDMFTDDMEFDIDNKQAVKILIDDDFSLDVLEPKKVTIQLTNPLPVTLEAIKFSVEGSGMIRPEFRKLTQALEPGASIKEEFELKARYRGSSNRRLLVDVDTKYVKDLKTSALIKINK